MKLFRDENGQTLVFTAFLACCLMGFMALAIDVGVLFRAQRRVQTAADAAAIAAGLAYWANGNGTTPSSCGGSTGTTVCTAAYGAANDNGVPSSQVTVNVPPGSGAHTGTSYVEVIIRQPNPSIFMGTFAGLFGSSNSLNPVTVAARAVAGIVPDQNCMITLNPTGADSLDVQGSAKITAPNCGIVVNSSNQSALCTTGNATITSPSIDIVGAQQRNPPCNGTQGNAQTGVAGVADPYANLHWPTSCTAGSGYTVPGGIINSTTAGSIPFATETVGTGATATSASVACIANTVSIADGYTLGTAGSNQIFVFMNGLVQPGGTGSFTVNGTIDIQGGTFTQKNYGLTINGPTPSSGDTYAALAFIVPTSNTTISCDNSYHGPSGPCVQMQFGSGFGGLDGILYTPGATMYLQDAGSSGPNVYTDIIANNLYDKNGTLVITDSYNHHHPDSPLNNVALVE